VKLVVLPGFDPLDLGPSGDLDQGGEQRQEKDDEPPAKGGGTTTRGDDDDDDGRHGEEKESWLLYRRQLAEQIPLAIPASDS